MVAYWYQALHSPFGIELICSDPEGARSRLYAARKAAQDAELNSIAITSSPFDPAKLWLVKKAARPPKPTNAPGGY